jgi:hypothetical protein
MKLEIPDGYEKIEKPREKTRRIKAEGKKRYKEAEENGITVRSADYGRQMVYRNGTRALRNMPAPIINLTIEQLREKSDSIFADERVMKIDPFPGEIVYVEDSCINGAIAYPFQRRMRFGTLKNNFTLYHEAAHILAPGNKHGYEFCRTMCLLIEWFESLKAANHMRMYLCW